MNQAEYECNNEIVVLNMTIITSDNASTISYLQLQVNYDLTYMTYPFPASAIKATSNCFKATSGIVVREDRPIGCMVLGELRRLEHESSFVSS